MARAVPTRRKLLNTALAWAVALLIAFPIIWTVLTSFKPEPQAVASPPVWFGFDWTLKNYFDVDFASPTKERFLRCLRHLAQILPYMRELKSFSFTMRNEPENSR